MKLVRKDDNSVEIVATRELIPGTCQFNNPRMENGELTFDYDGGTDVDWDGQKTETAPTGWRYFIDENGDVAREDEIELIEEEE